MAIFAAGLTDSSAGLLKDFAIAMAIAAAGLAFARLVWQPPVLGYLIAGLIIGPYTLPHPLISNLDTIELLAELGLVLLLFGIGLELGWRRIQEIGLRVLVIGVIEISALTFLGMLIASHWLGITGASSLYLGGAMAISSSAILLKGLRDSGNLRSGWGQTIVGILLVEDFAAVILLTVLAGIATTGYASLGDVGWLAAKLAIFCIAALAFGAVLAPRLMRILSRMQSDETLLVASLGCCFGLALGAEFLGLSAAAGAFLIGVVIGDTDAAGRVTRLVSPVRDMFGSLFFLSIGMLINYRTLDEFVVPALVVVGVFMGGKIMANTAGSILAGRRSQTALQVGMTMPQMGEFSLAIGRVSAADAVAGPIIGPILAISTAITSVLAPLTSRAAAPMYAWIERHSPPPLLAINLVIHLGVQSFWSAFSLPGYTGQVLKHLVRRILINVCIIAVLTAVGTAAVYTLPDLLTDADSTSNALLALILAGATVGINIPAAVAIWHELRALASLTVRAHARDAAGEPARYTLRTLIRDGLATALLLLGVLLLVPLMIRLFELGSLSAPLSIFLLVASAGALVFAGFHVHRVLEPIFRNTFIAPAAPVPSDGGGFEAVETIDVESPPVPVGDEPVHQPARPARAAAASSIDDDSTEDLWRFLEERIERFNPSSNGAADETSQTVLREAD